ncbi:MAG: SUKH-3 domain-containing protein [Deinococcaceae bacterium]
MTIEHKNEGVSSEKSNHDQMNQISEMLEQLTEMLERVNRLRSRVPFDMSTESAVREEWPSLEVTLNRSGWFIERKIDIASLANRENIKGFKINNFAMEFIEKFNELSIEFPLNTEDRTYVYIFDFLEVADTYSPILCEDHGKEVGTTLCPVGISEDGFVVLLIGENGKVFACVDTNIRFVANSYQDALESLNRNDPFLPING